MRPLKAVELWNEPWGHFFWRPEPDPAAYARLARPAAEAVRDAGAGVEVLVSADLRQVRADGAVRPWFAALLDADPGLPALVDGWSVHPYPEPRDQGPGAGPASSPYAFARVEQIRALARRRGAMRPIWITELGWSTSSGPGGVSEARQAAYLGAALDRALGPWRDFVASRLRLRLRPRQRRAATTSRATSASAGRTARSSPPGTRSRAARAS